MTLQAIEGVAAMIALRDRVLAEAEKVRETNPEYTDAARRMAQQLDAQIAESLALMQAGAEALTATRH